MSHVVRERPDHIAEREGHALASEHLAVERDQQQRRERRIDVGPILAAQREYDGPDRKIIAMLAARRLCVPCGSHAAADSLELN
jgi:hypothetical protein